MAGQAHAYCDLRPCYYASGVIAVEKGPILSPAASNALPDQGADGATTSYSGDDGLGHWLPGHDYVPDPHPSMGLWSQGRICVLSL